MKTLQDKNGLTVHVDAMTCRDDAGRFVGATPSAHRWERLTQGREKSAIQGNYVHGLAEMRRELEALPQDHDTFPEDDAWSATLVTPADAATGRRQCLQLGWFQDGGDPFLRLAQILSTLDFTQYSVPDFAPLRLTPLRQVSYGMRPMNDKTGLPLKVATINGEFARAGMLEGTAYLERRFRHMQGRNAMKSPGCYVDGLEALEREIAELSPQCDAWAPNERWSARVVTDTDWTTYLRHALCIDWFQEGGDPLERLAAILAGIDFMQYSKSEIDLPEE